MKTRWKVALGLVVGLAILLAVNTVTTNSQTKPAEVTADDGRILELSLGAVQVTDSGDPPAGEEGAQPIVLIHCYACSLHWFDRLEPLLAERHRVIRIDLLGFGGSEKPESGYDIALQAGVVAEAMNELGVEGALVAGHSMGGSVVTSLAEQASQLVDRAVLIDEAPDRGAEYGDGLPFVAELTYAPVIGQAMWRVSPDFAIREGYGSAFAPGFEMETGFANPDQVVEDYRAMTYTSYDEAQASGDEFTDETPLDVRLIRAAVPTMVIFGSEDQIYDPEASIEGYADVPGVRSEIVEGAGHAPQVEAPQEVARLLEDFSEPIVASDRTERPAKDRRPRKRGKRDRRR